MLRSCQAGLTDVRVVSLGFTGAELQFVLKVYNPNVITATLDSLEHSLYVDGVHLGDGVVTRMYDILSGSTVTVVIYFELSYSGALRTAWTYLEKALRESV